MTKNPQLRFLLKAVIFLAAALGIWWMLLMDPMLGGLRVATELGMRLLPGDGSAAHASIGADGTWLMQMPVPPSVARMDSTQRLFGRTSKDGPPVKVRSMKMPISGNYPILFTVGLPVFWALWFAAPGQANFWRGLLTGTAVLAVLAVHSLVFYSVYNAMDMLHLVQPDKIGLVLSSTRYFILNVTPYAVPLLLLLWLHPGLRQLILSGDAAVAEPVQPARKAATARRGRSR